MVAETCTVSPVAIVILAAGRSGRMGEAGGHKLLAKFHGVPLIRKSVLNALACECSSVSVVTGHRHQDVLDVICDLPIEVVRNQDYASGIAGSLRLGAAAAQKTQPEGIMIMLADMPALTTDRFDMLITTFQQGGGDRIVRAMANGSPGNPVIFPRSLHDDLQTLEGDAGARRLITSCGMPIIDVEIGEAGGIDVDTVEQMLAAGGVPESDLGDI